MSLQLRRGPESDIATSTFKEGELVLANDVMRLYIGLADGTAVPVNGDVQALIDAAINADNVIDDQKIEVGNLAQLFESI